MDQANQSQLSPDETLLIKAVSENSLEKVVNIVSTGTNININCKDEHGMSPLQHACYKGNVPIAKFLIERGANVNQNDHEHRYTSLMFAALGGHINIINLLLEHGANVHTTNTVGRNASQMAAFVGQHQSVAAINNYIPREYIEYYNKITGQEKEPRLSLRFIPTIHSLVSIVTVNPIRIAYFLESNSSVYEEAKKISNVLEHLCEKLFRSNDPNEMLSLKVHYLNFLFQHLNKALEAKEKSKSDNLSHEEIRQITHTIIKYWLKPNAKGFSENMERLLREAIRSYLYPENSLFQQLVRTLSTIEIGEEPSALSILSQTILGKSIGTEENNTCFTCSEMNPKKRCSKCKMATYCDEICQRLHWSVHKRVCSTSPPTIKTENTPSSLPVDEIAKEVQNDCQTSNNCIDNNDQQDKENQAQ